MLQVIETKWNNINLIKRLRWLFLKWVKVIANQRYSRLFLSVLCRNFRTVRNQRKNKQHNDKKHLELKPNSEQN